MFIGPLISRIDGHLGFGHPGVSIMIRRAFALPLGLAYRAKLFLAMLGHAVNTWTTERACGCEYRPEHPGLVCERWSMAWVTIYV